jgi:23S rRNA pseudouridine1911/1915/1917 synthase
MRMPQTVLDWLLEKHPQAKRQTLKRLVAARRVRINGAPATRLSDALPEGAEVRLLDRGPTSPRLMPADARSPRPKHRLTVIYEDVDLLVVDKPAGLLTSTVPRERRATLLAMVREHVAAGDARVRVGLIHRLDRDAGGLLVFSKTHDAFRALKRQFFEHSVSRVYLAVVDGRPAHPKGRIKSNLVELPDGRVRSTTKPGAGEQAVTDFELVKAGPNQSLLRVTLQTGRKHQIRAHLSERGTPIANDPIYNPKPAQGPLLLRAVELSFDHPTRGERVSFVLPDDPAFTPS